MHEINSLKIVWNFSFDWPRTEAMADFICRVHDGSFTAAGTGIEDYSRLALTRKMTELFESLTV